LSLLFNLFADNILPIIIVVGVGFVLQRTLKIDPRALSRVIFYAFTPALVFTILASSAINTNEILHMAGFTILVSACVGSLSWFLSRSLHLKPHIASAFILVSTFINAGNYGLSVNSFALGEAGLTWASIYFVTSSLLINSVGVYIASVGRTSPSKALLRLLKVPSLYAIPLALLVRISGVSLPITLWRPIDLLGSAAVPSMLILLGMQIARVGLPKRGKLVILAAGLRLIIAPLIAWLIASFMGMSGVSRQAGILESAMPTAVMTIVLATEFDVELEFVTAAVFVTTLISPLTITPLLAILGV